MPCRSLSRGRRCVFAVAGRWGRPLLTSAHWAEWKSTEQRIPILWLACHLGGRRPWFRCAVYSNGQYCGRRVAVLYAAGDLFACQHCYAVSATPASRRARKVDSSGARERSECGSVAAPTC